MKKLLLILMLTLTQMCFSQDSFFNTENEIKYDINLNLDKVNYNTSYKTSSYNSRGNLPIGVSMMMGGTAFVLAGILTPSTYVGGSTTNKKPFYQQPKFLPILSGGLLFTVGIGVSISGN
jgi:hypothetical protein